MLGIWRPVLWVNNNEPVTLFCILGAVDLAKVDLANLRYFFGLTLEQAAPILDISVPIAKRW
jgi:hypothetical protein